MTLEGACGSVITSEPYFCFFFSSTFCQSFYSPQDKIKSFFKNKTFLLLAFSDYLKLQVPVSMGSSNLASAADLSFALVSLERVICEAA